MAGWLFVVTVALSTANGCLEVAEQAPAEMLTPDPVDPTGAWLQTREPLLDGCNLGDNTEPVLWELDGPLLTLTGAACEKETFGYAGNRVTSVRTLVEPSPQPGCVVTATVTTELVFRSSTSYVGNVQIESEFSGTCGGTCSTAFAVFASRCANPAACTPGCAPVSGAD